MNKWDSFDAVLFIQMNRDTRVRAESKTASLIIDTSRWRWQEASLCLHGVQNCCGAHILLPNVYRVLSVSAEDKRISSIWPLSSTSALVQNNEQQDVYIPTARCEFSTARPLESLHFRIIKHSSCTRNCVLLSTELSLQNEGTCEMRYSYAFGFKVYLYEKCLAFSFNTQSFGS
jgi:hypothetical protein